MWLTEGPGQSAPLARGAALCQAGLTLSAYSQTPVPISVPVTIYSAPCKDTEFHDERKGSLIYLGIKGTNLSLFCEEVQGQPTLQVKVSGCAGKERSAVRGPSCTSLHILLSENNPCSVLDNSV